MLVSQQKLFKIKDLVLSESVRIWYNIYKIIDLEWIVIHLLLRVLIIKFTCKRIR